MTIFDGNASFSVKLPFDVTSLKVYSPVYDVYQDVDLENTEVYFTMPQQRNDFSSLPDSDADKVPDIYDDYPNDASRAYGVTWPHKKSTREWPSGFKYAYQIYEDLYPSTGDYDFNDFVFANKLDWQRGQGNKIVGGSVTTILWAVGGSIPHGLGMEVFSSNPPHDELTYMPDATTFSGDGIQADPNVTNGVILFNNAYDVMTQNYNNNGSGPTSDPDTISFTYTLNYNTKDVEILTYLFKTSDPSDQIRTVGTPPTESANMALFGTGQDDSPASWDWTTGSSFLPNQP
jgi:LruC domain-containing protein